MDFKDLNLDRSKIDEAIKECSGPGSQISCIKKGNGYHHTIKKNGKEALIIFFFNKGGTTTLNCNVGKNPELSLEIAKGIKDKTLITQKKSFSLAFRDVEEENFNLLKEYLSELKAINFEDTPSEVRSKIIRYKSPYGDEITITYYSNKTLMIQGRPLYLYTEIKLFFYEILSLEDVVKKENETYEINITTKDIRNELEGFIPNAFRFLDEKIIKVLTPSIFLNKLNVELEDYSAFLFPALRAMEGYMRQLIRIKGKTPQVRNVNKIGSLFNDPQDGNYQLLDFAKDDIACLATCNALEITYSFWQSKRHPLFHISKIYETTPIVYRKDQAEALLLEILKTVEDTYSKIII
jgi:hypothetical protein